MYGGHRKLKDMPTALKFFGLLNSKNRTQKSWNNHKMEYQMTTTSCKRCG